MTNEDFDIVKQMFLKKYPARESEFMEFVAEYESIKPFKANENIFETEQKISKEAHYVMRCYTTLMLEKTLRAMKIDIDNDANTMQIDAEGNIGTAGRIAKCWVGASIDDDTEMGSGRFMKPVRIASFPNTDKQSKIPITKRVAIYSNCSHHFIPFSSTFSEDSYAIISYIPKDKVLGISKLQRLADYVSRRFWLQEDLTKELYNQVVKAAETDDVYVKLCNIKHGCEWLRGAKNNEGGFTSEYYGGMFSNIELRKQVDL